MLGNLIRGRNENTPKTHTRTGNLLPPILRPNRDSDNPSRANHQHPHTIKHTEKYDRTYRLPNLV